MKISIKRRMFSLLLAVAMLFTLAPSAALSETVSGVLQNMELSYSGFTSEHSGSADYGLLLEPNATVDQGSARITVNLYPSDDDQVQAMHVSWSPMDSPYVGVSEQESGHIGTIYGKAAGVAIITVSAGESTGAPQTKTIEATVSGVQLSDSLAAGVQVAENRTVEVTLANTESEGDGYYYKLFGNAASSSAKLDIVEVNGRSNVNTRINGRTIILEGRQAGNVMMRLTVSSAGRTYPIEFPVTVTPNEQSIEWTEGCSPAKPLKFSSLEERIASKYQEIFPGGTLTSIVGLSVPTTQGTIYQGYTSSEDTGAGAGSSITYYTRTAVRGPYIKDLTFVPNSSFTGEKATLSFTAQGTVGGITRTTKCRVEVTLEDVHTDLILTTRADVPLKLSATDFSKICQEQTGGTLSYVIFTLPPASQGVLFRDYKTALDYGSRVTASEEYDRKGLDDITFVPTEGYVGPVTIPYAGYSTTGAKYNGELIINVERTLDESIQYQDYGSGTIAFSGSDFDAYSQTHIKRYMRAGDSVYFTPPPTNQGALYYRWRNSSRDVPISATDPFSLSMLNYITFVAADDFDGVVRIPFVCKDAAGAELFSGTVELHIQNGSRQNGDITYTCQPSQSVKLQLTDFANLCQSMTNQRLYYVTFQALPDFNQGSLFYNRTSSGVIGTRVSTAAKYFNSANPYLNNVSFWATQSFRSVEVPFTLTAVDGQTFSGLMVISNGEGAGGGRAGTVSYTTSGQQPVTFSGANFDTACRQATNAALNYVQLSLPGSGQGILYYDYRAGDTYKAFDPSTTLYLTGDTSISKVTFVPASGFTGTAYIPFTGTAINGTVFQGTVEVTVRAGAALGSIVHYRTGGAPVYLQSYDVSSASGVGQIASVRLTGLPDASQGRIYYQYVSPTQYSWLGNTTTSYSVTGDPSVSNLVFIPKAGYQGVVTIPYAVTGYDGTTGTGSVEITVTLPETSLDFDDMGSFSAQTKAAVDYLSSQGVVNGTSYRHYEPGASILRGDFCLMVSRAFRFNVGGSGQGFNDVPAGSYYAQAIREMYALGIVNGVGGGLFQPETTITRQDAAVMVCRALDKAGMTLPQGSDQAALANYRDRNQVDGYAQAALGSLLRAGFFPVSGDRLNPKTPITRADMALLLHRAMTNFS